MGADTLNKLVLIEDLGTRKTAGGRMRRYGLYLCSCGAKTEARVESVKHGTTRSCGCGQQEATVKANRTHGHCSRRGKSPLYVRWSCMIARCTYPAHASYSNYGGRGIRVHPRWHDFENWLADMGPSYFPGACQDRINPDGDYCPGNVQWLSREDNRRKQYTDRRRYESLTHEEIQKELNG